jgi:hypothetical protein
MVRRVKRATGSGWQGVGLIAMLSLLPAGACAKQLGARGVSGAGSELQKQQQEAETDPKKQAARVAGSRAVTGAVEALDQPEQRARLKQVIDEAVSQAVASALATATRRAAEPGAGTTGGHGPRTPAEELAAQLAGSATENAVRKLALELRADGRLGSSLTDASERVSASVVEGATNKLNDLFPGCTGPDAAACRERRLQEITHTAGAGLAAGVRDSIGWPILIFVAALAGVAGAAAHRFWSERRGRRQLRPA